MLYFNFLNLIDFLVSGYILEYLPVSSGQPVTDKDENLILLCQVIENIFQKGYNGFVHSPFGLTKRDYWSWIDQMRQSNE